MYEVLGRVEDRYRDSIEPDVENRCALCVGRYWNPPGRMTTNVQHKLVLYETVDMGWRKDLLLNAEDTQ